MPIVIGSAKQNPVMLCSTDWANVYCDNMNNLRAGVERNGPWHVIAEQPGNYEIRLRRWPVEAAAAITASVPAFQGIDGGLGPGKALPVAKARLKVGSLDETKPVSATDEEITFTVTLPAGKRLPMQSWLIDRNDQPLCGAYFAYVKRL